MINVMLVAGDNTPKLAEFLVQRGTFSLDFSYRSLTEEVMHVKDSIINVEMVDSNYTNFTVHKTKAKVSFAEIYDYVIGVSVAENYKNTFKDIYRVERNSDSTVAYMPADDVSLKVEPFSYDSVNMFEEAKANS